MPYTLLFLSTNMFLHSMHIYDIINDTLDIYMMGIDIKAISSVYMLEFYH